MFNPLTGLITATGYGMFLQYMKTQRDTLQESAKTHEDAINIGITELNNRIKEVENNINHASKFAKVGARFGRNALHRNKKQLAILQSFAQMRNTDVLQSVDVLIDDLKTKTGHQKQTVLADTLARMDA
ncbi:MAG: hypothetical protein PHR06_13660 [Candidatus Cloacimonetes bacterium]|nr:hypothetical protein [Candidatus Cloacimonadota bacterium]